MKTTNARLLLLLPWLSPPVLAGAYLLLWDRIPERIAVQFDSSGAVTNSMTRGQSLAFSLAVLVFIIVMSTFRLRRRERDEQTSGLLILNASVFFVMLIFFGLLKYNITGSLF
ncbi:MAG TPA: hypothetical protein VF297_08505 [Pyrinomonadaceae bacterium]